MADGVLWTASQRTLGATSLLSGWLPLTMQLITVIVLGVAVGIRTRRWWLRWMPCVAAVGFGSALAVHWYIASEGLAGDPAPLMFWVWTALTGAAVAVVALGWPSAQWWRRAASVLAVPMALLCTVVMLNMWVAYARTIDAAWGLFTLGPLPNQTDVASVNAMAEKGVIPHKGRIVPVTTPADASHFAHRQEFVYLPPAWFTSVPPPPLPVVMMIGGEFGMPADWLWAGDAQDTADAYAAAHDGNAPVMVFVDKGGTFNKDTECINGPRGNAADHLTKDVLPYLISKFGVSREAANWGIVGWSMGGTCALDLTVMHPDLFGAFIDIAGDMGPNVGTKEQTIDRLFGGDEQAWELFDPATVMAHHGSYTGVSGLFINEVPEDPEQYDERALMANLLAQKAAAAGIDCALLTYPGKHDWPFGAGAFQHTLPWLASRLGVPGASEVPMPGAHPIPAGRGMSTAAGVAIEVHAPQSVTPGLASMAGQVLPTEGVVEGR
jgi:S-formylglutathione hydrolase FrmB